MVIWYLVLSALAILLFGGWGIIGAVIVGIAMIISSSQSNKAKTNERPIHQQATEPKENKGWKGMANKKLSACETELREMDTGTRHLGESRKNADTSSGTSPWPSAK